MFFFNIYIQWIWMDFSNGSEIVQSWIPWMTLVDFPKCTK